LGPKAQSEGGHPPGIAHAPAPHAGAASRAGVEPCAAKVERRRLILFEPQDGHFVSPGSSPARTRTSDVFSQRAQRYSRRGIEWAPARRIRCRSSKGKKMRRALFSFIGILLSSSSSSLLAITAEEVVAKNVEARGGAAALAALKSLRRTGRFVSPRANTNVTVSEVKARPGRLRQELTDQGLTEIEAFDGEKGWRVDPFEGRKDPAAMSEDALKTFRIEADLDGPWVDTKAKGDTLEYLGTDEVEGTVAHKVRVVLKEGGNVTVFVDPDTWMVIRDVVTVTVRGAERRFETDYGDYEKAGGVYFPMSEATGAVNSPPASRGKVIYDKAEVNVETPASLFAFPSPAPGAGR
jgi:hypothetical protein